MLRSMFRLIIKYHILILVLAILASLVSGYYASKLTLESDLAELLPENFKSVKALNRIKNEVGGVSNLRIILESSDFQALKTFADVLEKKMLASPYISKVDYKNDVEFYKKNGLLLLEMAKLDSLQRAIQNKIDSEKQKLNPLFVDDLFGDDGEDEPEDDFKKWDQEYQEMEPQRYYTNDDSTVLVIKAIPAETNTSLKYIEKVVREVKEIVDEANPRSFSRDMNVLYGGNIKNRLDEYEVVKDDIMGTALYGFGGVFLLIVVYFRRLSGAILITITLICSLTWTFGVTYWVIGRLNTITGFLFVILFGLGIDYGIHAFARYVESRRSGLNFEDSIEKMVNQTGKALATTAITTSAAFFSLTIMDFRGFSELGFISGVGMLFALIGMIVVLPAFITFFERLGMFRIKPAKKETIGFKSARFPFSTPILIITFLTIPLSIYCTLKVSFEYDFTNLRAITKERQEVSQKTAGVFKLSESPAVVLADSKEEIPAIEKALRNIMEADTLTPTIETFRSVYSLVPEDQDQKLAKIGEIRELVNNEAEGVVSGEDKKLLDKLKGYLAVGQPFTWDDFPEKDKEQFINKKGEIGNFVFIYPSVPLRDGKNAIDFRDDVGEFKTDDNKTYYASSSNIILAEMFVIMIREGEIAVILTFFVVFLIVLADFRSFKAAVLVLTPLALGILWMIGIMYLTGMKWNLFNIVVIPSIIGIGVDNGVHIYHRCQEEGHGSLLHVLRNTGMAISMTTSTTIVGYSGLIVANHPGLNSIGKLAVIGLIATFFTAMVVLPAILQYFESRNERESKSEPKKGRISSGLLE